MHAVVGPLRGNDECESMGSVTVRITDMNRMLAMSLVAFQDAKQGSFFLVTRRSLSTKICIKLRKTGAPWRVILLSL
jgi:hypothetical protein